MSAQAYDEYGNPIDQYDNGLPGDVINDGPDVSGGISQYDPGYPTLPVGYTPPTPGSPSAAINDLNPNADPSKSFVQAGDTGGYLDGVGITLGAGTSTTQAGKDAALSQAAALGWDQNYINDYLAKNPGDYERMYSALIDDGGGGSNDGGGGGGGSSSGSSGGTVLSDYQQTLRNIILGELGKNSQPVSANDPTLKPAINSALLANQRASDQSRSQQAAMLAAQGLSSSGTADTRMQGIAQAQGEADSGMVATILLNEMNNRRNALTQQLNIAISSGDTQAAQQIQNDLARLTLQMQQAQFEASLANNRYQFDNNLGWLQTQAEINGNNNSTTTLLGG